MNVAIYTLGCKVNQYESQALEQLLLQRGHALVPFDGTADAYIINTCTVTAVSDKKSRQIIRQARRNAPNSIVAVCGCYPQTHGAEQLDVDLISGTGERAGFLDLLEETYSQRQPLIRLDNAFRRREFELLPPGGLEGRTRAMLKIEDGCANFCTYCIIPYARGGVRSLALERAVDETRCLAQKGYRELVLTGIEISSWGNDLPGRPQLIALVEAICAAAPELRVRLGSLEPGTITPDFCARAAALKNLCPHFHLSMQSGSDSVLRRMNRKYDSEKYYNCILLLREYFHDPAITTDMIVGFPGETDAEFEESLTFLRRCAFSAMHVFPYSKRPGTPAAALPDQIPSKLKQNRARAASAAALELSRHYLARQVGQVADVLFEVRRDGRWYGHSARYCTLFAESDRDLSNQICSVCIEEVEGDALRASLV